MRVVVVGGGIAGLAAAWELADTAEVLLLEASAAVGGKLRVRSLAGFAVDVGAEALLARRPEGVDLATSVGLADELIAPLTTTASIRAGGATHPLPAGTLMGIPADLDAARASGLLSGDALARIEAEPALPAMAALTADVAVGAVVRQRLGDEVVDRLVEPLLGGVYAGRADAISLRAAIPALAGVLAGTGGSLVTAARSLTPPPSVPPSPVFASLRGGLGRLPSTLASAGRFEVRCGVTVRAIRSAAAGFVLECGATRSPELITADAVVVAVPPAKAAALLRDVAPVAATELAGIDTASVGIVSLAYRDVSLPAGSGLLIAAGEGLAVKGVTLTSQKWPGTPNGLVLLRASVGRAGENRDLQRDDADLLALVRAELGELIGLSAEPVDWLVTRWGGGLPQYRVGHVERVARIRAAVAEVPGLAVCGAAYDGVGIPACIASARSAVGSVRSAS